MTPELIDHLTTQYVWVVQNEYVWKVKVDAAVSHNNFNQFKRVCWEQIARIARLNQETVFGEQTSWITNELMRQYFEGRHNVPSDFLPWFLSQIDEDTAKAKTILDSVEDELQNAIFTTKESNIMNTTAFSTVHFIFGQDVKLLNEAQLIEAIKKVEGEIANLKTVKTASKKIEAKIVELEAMLASIVAVLDAK